MTEFGHTAVRAPGFCADSWGVGPFIIRGIRFEDSDRFGPYFIRKDGRERKQ